MIRIWKLGDHRESIFPQAEAIDKLTRALEKAQENKDSKDPIDIVWDSMISVTVIADDGTVSSDDIEHYKKLLEGKK